MENVVIALLFCLTVVIVLLGPIALFFWLLYELFKD